MKAVHRLRDSAQCSLVGLESLLPRPYSPELETDRVSLMTAFMMEPLF